MNQGYFKKDVELRFCDCDYKKRAKLSTIMCYMADIAGLAYADKGYSHTWLWENNFVFLLSRVSLHMTRTPKADEKLTIQTWEHSTKGALFNRLFEIYDETNTIIIGAYTQWVLVNPQTRCVLRPNSFTGKMDFHEDKKVNTLECEKLKISNEILEIGERKITYSDIDANGHVYNAVYASIATDFLSSEEVDRNIVDFRINFKKEAMLGEILKINKFSQQNKTYIVGYVENTISYECEFTFE